MGLYNFQKRESSLLSRGMYVLFATVSIGIGIQLQRFLFSNETDIIYLMFPKLAVATWNNQTKAQLLLTVLCYCSIFLAVCIILVLICRVALNKPPGGTDPVSITTLNKVMYNTVEQSLIFFPSFSYFLFYHASNRKEIALVVGAMFVLGRTLFLLGYEFVHFNMPFLRGVGFSLSLSSSLISIGYCFNYDLVSLVFQ